MHSELSDLPLNFEHKGRTYKVRLIDDDTDTLFERQEYARAIQTLRDSRDLYTEEEYDAEKAKLRELRENGYFSLDAMRENPKLQNQAGQKVLALVMGISIREVRNIALEAPEKLTDLLFDLYSISYPSLREDLQAKKKSIGQAVREKMAAAMAEARQALADSTLPGSESFADAPSRSRPASSTSTESACEPSAV